MPLLATLAAIATIAAAGTTTGLALDNAISGPGTPKPTPTTPAKETPAEQQALQNQQKALIGQQAPNVISQTSGLTNPDYVAQISQLLAGTAGQSGSQGAAQQAIAKAFGLSSGSPTPAGGAGGTPNFTPAGSGGSPGGANASTQPVALSEFVNQYIT